jgi:beta-glucanase (GH16 family)
MLFLEAIAKRKTANKTKEEMPAIRTKAMLLLISITLILSCKKNEVKPGLSINDVNVSEGNGGTTTFDFELTLSARYSEAVTVHYETTEGSAKFSSDFQRAEGNVTFQPGETKKTVSVQVVGDDIKENDETFLVTLSNAFNANLTRASGTATIKNDDTKVNLPITGYTAPSSYAGYSLVWSDDFDGPALNAANWSFDIGDGCPNLCGWGNNELQYYTNSAENLFFQDGKMIIQAKKESYGGKNYTSAKIKTDGKRPFKFGRIDIRAILPEGKGLWPAFWLLPQSSVYGGWPRSGEIDLMEYLGHEPAKVYGTAHYGPGPGSTNTSRNYTLSLGGFQQEYHVFSIEWKLDQIKWYVDGNLYSTLNKSDLGTLTYPFNESFYVIINLAVGGNWPGAPDAYTSFPQYLVVDYIRVFQ